MGEKWTQSEVNKLQQYYRKYGKKCKVLFPGRSILAIRSKAQYQMFSRKPNDDDYKKILKEHPGERMEWYAKKLGVDIRTAKKHIRKINHEA